MKRILILLTVVAILASCSKESNPAELIVGKWRAISYKINGQEVLNSNAFLTDLCVIFNADSTFYSISAGDSSDIESYIISSTNLYLITSPTDTTNFIIHTLNETTLDVSTIDQNDHHRMLFDKE